MYTTLSALAVFDLILFFTTPARPPWTNVTRALFYIGVWLSIAFLYWWVDRWNRAKT